MSEAVIDWVHEILEEHFPGWEIDDGASGTITLDVAARRARIDHAARIHETLHSRVEV